MPHSSGGGSHGGGSHSSHSHSSRGGSSSRPMHRIRHTAFPGARRYVCYRKNKAEYVYANYDMSKKPSKARFFLLLFYVPFLFAVIAMLASVYNKPRKISVDYETNMVLDDRAYILDDNEKRELQNTFREFFDKTGIMPSLITVNNEDWKDNYTNLENYAYDLYVNTFTDEKHWLIVYSEPMVPDSSFNDWYWEGMQGDDTDNIITEQVGNKFTTSLQKYLLQNQSYTVGTAVKKAFDELTPVVMDAHWNFEFIPIALFMLGFITLHACLMLGITPGSIKYRNAVECPHGSVEYRCTYCGGIYVVGTCITCPHCGAPAVKSEDLEIIKQMQM